MSPKFTGTILTVVILYVPLKQIAENQDVIEKHILKDAYEYYL